jgi:hypothetical protein
VAGDPHAGPGPEGFDELLGHPLALLERAARKDHPELVSAQPGEDVGRPHRPAEPVPDQCQDVVSRHVAEGVVDVLEPVEVDEHHRPVLARSPGDRDLPLELLAKSPPVEQARQRVVVREMPEALLLALPAGYILSRPHEAIARGPVPGKEGPPDQDHPDVAVRPSDAVLDREGGARLDRVADAACIGVEVVGVDEVANRVGGRLEHVGVDPVDAVDARGPRGLAGAEIELPPSVISYGI